MIPAPVDVSSFFLRKKGNSEADGSPSMSGDDRIAAMLMAMEDTPLRRFQHLQVEFVTTQHQFITHMPPFRSRVSIPDPVLVSSTRDKNNNKKKK